MVAAFLFLCSYYICFEDFKSWLADTAQANASWLLLKHSQCPSIYSQGSQAILHGSHYGGIASLSGLEFLLRKLRGLQRGRKSKKNLIAYTAHTHTPHNVSIVSTHVRAHFMLTFDPEHSGGRGCGVGAYDTDARARYKNTSFKKKKIVLEQPQKGTDSAWPACVMSILTVAHIFSSSGTQTKFYWRVKSSGSGTNIWNKLSYEWN